MLGVEDENTRARALYDRLGYKECGHERDTWDEADEYGNIYTYHAEVTLMRKRPGGG
jgi:RimJ/RimL family protein N-acetyltransferase